MREEKTSLQDRKTQNRREVLLIMFIALFFICLGILAGLLRSKYIYEKDAQHQFEILTSEMEKESHTSEQTDETIYESMGIENPGKVFDWEYLWEQNPDIYGWIYIPETQIDYPILQHASDDTYYLAYNLDGTKGYPGCIYTEQVNAKDFSDHNTLIYGHNMKNGTMFHDLHKFSERDFFDEQKYVFIYLPDEVLVYEIYAAYEFTDAHILYSYDCFTEEGFAAYLEMAADIYEENGNFREEIKVTAQDKVITLSTCVGGESDKRYLVQAVLYDTNEFEWKDEEVK